MRSPSAARGREIGHRLNPEIPLTTRDRRPEETDGREYHFVTFDDFRALIKANLLADYGVLNDEYYGELKLDGEAVLPNSGDEPIKARRRTLVQALGLPDAKLALEQLRKSPRPAPIDENPASARSPFVVYNRCMWI